MNTDYTHMSEKDLDNKILELISSGHSYSSPEVTELFKIKAQKYKEKLSDTSTNSIDEYSKLVEQGYSPDSPEMINFFRRNARSKARPIQAEKTTPYKKNTPEPHYYKSTTHIFHDDSIQDSEKNVQNFDNNSVNENIHDSIGHFVIDTLTGDYSLLDSNYKVVDTAHTNPFLKFFTKKYHLRVFKKQLKSDFKNYKMRCKLHNKKISPELKKINRQIKFYLWFCPDADYNILELLRKNITKINPNYPNYQVACRDYLKELAHLKEGNANNLGFDINLATIDGLSGSNHRYISNIMVRSDSTVNDYIKTKKPQHYSSNPNQNYSSYTYTQSERSSVNMSQSSTRSQTVAMPRQKARQTSTQQSSSKQTNYQFHDVR